MALASGTDFKAPPSTRSNKTEAKKQATHTANVAGRTKAREEAANGIFQLAAFGCVVTKQYADAGAIANNGQAIAHEAAQLAETNEGVGRLLDYLMEAGPYAGLITAVMPLALQLMANHGLVKAELVAGAGVQSPQALEAQVKADMARQAHAALMAQQEAEQAMHAMEAEMRQRQTQEQTEAPTSPNGSHPLEAETL